MPNTEIQKMKSAPATPQAKWLPRGAMDEIEDNLTLVAPEVDFISTRYVVKLPYNDPHFKDRWQLRLYIAKLVERKLGDDVQLTSLKVRKPSLKARSLAKVASQVPQAKVYVTLKF